MAGRDVARLQSGQVQRLQRRASLLQYLSNAPPDDEFPECRIRAHTGYGQNGRRQARLATYRQPCQPGAIRNAPQRHGGATFRQQPPGQGANFGDRLRRYLRHAQVIRAAQGQNPARPASKLERQHQRRRVESRPIAAAGDQREFEPMIEVVQPAMQQNDHRPILPALRRSGRAGHKRRCFPRIRPGAAWESGNVVPIRRDRTQSAPAGFRRE